MQGEARRDERACVRTCVCGCMWVYVGVYHTIACCCVLGVCTTCCVCVCMCVHVQVGKLSLVDLAGSESVGKTGAEGTRLQEAKNINR